MKLLVTGSTGLVGRELVRQLRNQGHEVVLYDTRPMDSETSRDVRDAASLREAVQGCDGVYHLAAVSRVAWGEEDPANCVEINVDATRLLVRIILSDGAPWLVFASSREVYGDPAARFVTEKDPVAPVNVYGRSKADAELVLEAARSAGLRAATVRLSNVYGNMNDHHDRAVPSLLWRALQGEQIMLTGGDNYFDFVHVRDSVNGLISAGELLAQGATAVPTVHLATGVPTSLNELAHAAIALCQSPSEITLLPRRTFDVAGFCGDPALAAQVLNWKPQTSLQEGMAELRDEMIAEGRPIPPAIKPGSFGSSL